MKQTNKRKLGVLLGLVVVVSGGWVWQWLAARAQTLPPHIVTGNARLEMGRAEIATLYAGRIESVAVNEGDAVTAGQELARISAAQVSAQLDAAQAAKQRAQAAVDAQQQKLDIAALDFRNTQNLHRDALVSSSELSKRNAQLKGERAALMAAKAARAEAEAQIQRIEDVHQDMILRAPRAGRVEYRLAEPGEVIAAGTKVVSLLNPAEVSMSVFLPTDTMARLSVGAPARIRPDGVDAVFPATVTFIAAQAQFTPKYVETRNEREKLMYRVKLTIPPEVALKHRHLLKDGLTGEAYVNTDTQQDFPSTLSIKLPQE